jgi:hypothetical protein
MRYWIAKQKVTLFFLVGFIVREIIYAIQIRFWYSCGIIFLCLVLAEVFEWWSEKVKA